MKKILVSMVALLLAISLIAVGCAAPAPAPAPAPAVKAITITYADFGPPGQTRAFAVREWQKRITERTNGQIRFENYWSQSLVKSLEGLDACKTGFVDATIFVSSFYGDKFPLYSIGSICFVPFGPYAEVSAMHGLMETYQPSRDEFEQNKLVWLNDQCADQYHWHGVVPVKTMADFKGLRVRATGTLAKAMDALGAAPVSIPTPEVYEAMQRGTIDGVCESLDSCTSYGHYELIKYLTFCYLGLWGGMPTVMNEDVWAKLSDEQKSIIREVGSEYPEIIGATYWVKSGEALDKIKQAGVEIYELPMSERDAIYEKSQFIHQDWIKERGLHGQEAYDIYMELGHKYLKELPAVKKRLGF